MPSIKRQTRRRYKPTKCTAKHLENEEHGETLAQFVLGVPRAEEVDNARKEDGLGDAQKDAEGEEGAVVLGRGRSAAYTAPDYGGATDVCDVKRSGLGRRKVIGGSSVRMGRTQAGAGDLRHDEVGGDLERNVANCAVLLVHVLDNRAGLRCITNQTKSKWPSRSRLCSYSNHP